MPNKNKAKGNSFEREVCKYLKVLTGLEFLRVPSSGAYIGKSNIHRANDMDADQIRIMDGDIITPKEFGDWSIECKFYKEFAWKKLFQPEGAAQLNKWISQAKETFKPYWFLIFKINNCGQYCVVDIDTASNFEFKLPECYFIYQNKYIVMDMKMFFELNYKRIIDENNRD